MSSNTESIDEHRGDQAFDLDDPSLYLNRELSWLSFNRRVLCEAESSATPLLERVKFLAIFGSNLDEFFMKRIGGLKQQVGAGVTQLTVDGRTPDEQIAQCRDVIQEALGDEAFVLAEIRDLLRRERILLCDHSDLSEPQRAYFHRRFVERVEPLVTPLAVDPAHPFPFVSNLSVNLLVEVRDHKSGARYLLRVKVPVSRHTPRFVRLDTENVFVPLEQVIAANLDEFLPGADILSCSFFRVTRNAIVDGDKDKANDLLEFIESELQERRFAPVTRLEVSPDMPQRIREYLCRKLELTSEDDVFEVSSMLAVRDLMQFASLPRPDLKYAPHVAVEHPRLSPSSSIISEVAARGPILLHHPYHSFDRSVIRLIEEAVDDPQVLAIKTTVYRTARDSAIVPLLTEAVKRGKQVVVVVELKARFDEAANIQWANHLEEGGIHVSYGVMGYKTHAKLTLVVRLEDDGELGRYVHLATGNYNAETARLYCDEGIITAEPDIGADAAELFNLMTSGSIGGRHYGALLVAPETMKPGLIARIERERELHLRQGGGALRFKCNALEDPDVTRALYRAALAGVQIDLVVRDSCRLRPGIAGLSESVRVVSVVGRFLEHSRIYYFRNGGEDEYFLGSADAMSRNLTWRVEALVPVRGALCGELDEIFRIQLDPDSGGWEMDADGHYQRRATGAGNDAQARLFERLRQRAAHAAAGTGAVGHYRFGAEAPPTE